MNCARYNFGTQEERTRIWIVSDAERRESYSSVKFRCN
jgi:hypothetical protein